MADVHPAGDRDFAATQQHQRPQPTQDECDLLRTAREQALGVLRSCVAPAGFRASALGYPQIWARDSIVAGLGAVASGDANLQQTFRLSLETLGAHRTPLGHIPLNVDPGTGEVSGENAAGVDANLWFVLGHGVHWTISSDREFLRANWAAIESAVLWLRY